MVTNLFDDEDESDTGDSARKLQQQFNLSDQLVDSGFAVFVAAVYPKSDGTLGKIPLTPHGHLDATTDKQLVREWLIDIPHHPPGLPSEYETVIAFVPGSGNCGVLDCDIKHGKTGDKTYNHLVKQYGAFATSAWHTPSNGVNILFRKPTGQIFSNRSPWDGIDIRVDNGWVVAPGNQTKWGNWEWHQGMGPNTATPLPDQMISALTPSALNGQRPATNQQTIDFIEASPQVDGRADIKFGEQIQIFQRAQTGSRHDALVRIIGWAFGMSHLDLRWAMLQIQTVWDVLTDGEKRESEPKEVATWIVGQELPKRNLPPTHAVQQSNAGAPATTAIDDYQDDTFILTFEDIANEDHIVEGLIVPGRWLQLVAPSKQGKSSLLMFTAIELAEGRHPYEGTPTEPMSVLYCDGEMGYTDLKQLIADCGHDPVKLAKGNLHCTIDAMRLDSEVGAERLIYWIDRVKANVLILDGLNGFINPEADENATPTWNPLYSRAIQPIKRRGVAIISGDNLGKDPAKGVRGHSIKTDKADAVMRVKLTDFGSQIALTHGRAGAYLDKLDLNAEGFDRSKPIRYWRASNGWLHGTAAAAAILDQINVPTNMGRPKVRELLKAAAANAADPEPFRIRNDVLADAIRYRKAGLAAVINNTTNQTP
jgi:Bifunctional DNA primase/polymerase, N-terminal/AAA domain